MVVPLVLSLRRADDEGSVHRVLMTIIVCQRGMDVRWLQVGIRRNDLRCTVAMCHLIGDEVDEPMDELRQRPR